MAGREDRGGALTRQDLVERVHARLGRTRAEAQVLVEGCLAAMMDALADPTDGELKLPGFGTFHVHRKTARLGRNPATSERLLLSKRKVLLFRSSTMLRAAMNRGRKP